MTYRQLCILCFCLLVGLICKHLCILGFLVGCFFLLRFRLGLLSRQFLIFQFLVRGCSRRASIRL